MYARQYQPDDSSIGPFQVNEYQGIDQSEPSVGTLRDGNYVISWHSLNQDGSGYGVYAKVYSSNSIVLKSEFLVNSETTSDQMYPSVGTFSNGGFVIAWQQSPTTNNPSSINAQRYNPDHSKNGNQILLTGPSNVIRQQVSVGAFSDGGFVMVYNRVNSTTNLVNAQCYHADGSLVLAEAFQVNTYTGTPTASTTNNHPKIGMFPDDSFVIVWQNYGYDNSGYGIYAQLYSSDCIQYGDQFQVNTYAQGDQTNPGVGTFVGDNNQFIVVWMSGANSDFPGIRGQIFNSDSSTFGAEFSIYGTPEIPYLSTFSDGGYLVAYDFNNDLYLSLFQGLSSPSPTPAPVSNDSIQINGQIPLQFAQTGTTFFYLLTNLFNSITTLDLKLEVICFGYVPGFTPDFNWIYLDSQGQFLIGTPQNGDFGTYLFYILASNPITNEIANTTFVMIVTDISPTSNTFFCNGGYPCSTSNILLGYPVGD